MDYSIEQQIKKQLRICFGVYGIEGTLEKIEELYSAMPDLKNLWICEFNKIIKGENNGNS